MDFATIVLWVSAVTFFGVGGVGMFVPRRILEPLGGKLDTPSVANEIRATYGGAHSGVGLLVAYGALTPAWRIGALALTLAFTGGLCIGRAVSWLADGTPNRYLRFFYGLEAVGAVLSGIALWNVTRSSVVG
jgi:hypothetical protein